MRHRLLALPLLLLVGTANAETLKVKQLALADIKGETHRLVNESTKAVVLVFISTECPVANSFQPALAKLCSQFGEEVTFVMLHPDSGTTQAAAVQHMEEFKISVPVNLDQGQQLARQLKATKTPEAFVLLPGGEIAYRGRINDGFGKPKPTKHDLRDAITAVVLGQEVKVPKTRAVGCPIDFRDWRARVRPSAVRTERKLSAALGRNQRHEPLTDFSTQSLSTDASSTLQKRSLRPEAITCAAEKRNRRFRRLSRN